MLDVFWAGLAFGFVVLPDAAAFFDAVFFAPAVLALAGAAAVTFFLPAAPAAPMDGLDLADVIAGRISGSSGAAISFLPPGVTVVVQCHFPV